MADSPKKDSEGVLRLTVFSGGSQLPDTTKIVDIEVVKAVNSIPIARLTVLDGDMANNSFPVSDAALFEPGADIEIKAGYSDNEETIFKGIVVKHNLKITGDNYSRLDIECRDKAVAMTVGRNNANYIDSKDSDISTSLIGKYSGLSADVKATSTQHKEIVQYYCSDWDFLIARAELNSSLVIVDDSSVAVGPPETSSSAILTVTYGQDLMEFHAGVDARAQYKKVKSVSWDPGAQAILEQTAGTENLNAQGNQSSADLAKVINLDEFKLQTPTVMENDELSDWAKGQQVKSGLSRITGRMIFQGSAKAKPGTLIELKGVSERFNGDVFVSSIRHEIVDGNWFTEVDFGLSDEWFLQKHDVSAPSASGLLPGVEGLHIGVVMKLDEDPEQQHRVQVRVPVLQASAEGIWARLGNFYASNSFGDFFIPEIGDEVVLGYLNNDPGHPIILGSLYSSANSPPYSLTADNFIKAIVTKSQLKVEFDDENKVITVETPGANKIIISDKDQSILIQDETSNKVELSTSGILLDSPQDITIKAAGTMSLEATGEISIASSADLKASGMNIDLAADIGLTASGGASAEVSAGGNTTIKGAMVLIN